jgi:hypothetical protein
MSLTLGSQPGFTELLASVFDAGNPVSDSVLKALLSALNFAVVRNEQFYGYYKDGETVELPASPADGYQYQRSELRYSWARYWSGSAGSACAGIQTPPTRGVTTGQGTLLQFGDNVDQATGLVSCTTSYYKTSETDTSDGILLVITHAQRSR